MLVRDSTWRAALPVTCSNLQEDFTSANLISAQFDGADIEGADFTDSLLDKAVAQSLCKRASGVNSRTGVPTAESLMCPE